MTPKEKAIQLYERNKYLLLGSGHSEQNYWAKAFAKETVNEILKITWVDKFLTVEEYWQEVKTEINKIEL
jgi:preprotein translocase subunit SecE